jgi:hypothetical protein
MNVLVLSSNFPLCCLAVAKGLKLHSAEQVGILLSRSLTFEGSTASVLGNELAYNSQSGGSLKFPAKYCEVVRSFPSPTSSYDVRLASPSSKPKIERVKIERHNNKAQHQREQNKKSKKLPSRAQGKGVIEHVMLIPKPEMNSEWPQFYCCPKRMRI